MWLVVAVAAAVGGCERAPRTPTSQPTPVTRKSQAPALPHVAGDRGLMFIFFDRRAELRTVERLGQVEPSARAAVQILDPTKPLEGDKIIVADLRKKSPQGYRRWIETRATWLAKAMPKFSVLKTPIAPAPAKKAKKQNNIKQKRVKRRRPRRRRPRKKTTAPSKAAQKLPEVRAPKPKRPPVLLFSTGWCPSCKRAKAYFIRRKVRFAEFDVERDQQAARHFLTIQRRAGLRPGVVPLIMVGNRAFQGFSELRMEQVLIRAGILPQAGTK